VGTSIFEAADVFGAEAGLKHIGEILLALAVLSSTVAGNFQESTIEVRVVRGNTLRMICETYLRDPADWPEVARFNRMANPNLILPDQIILIPARLAKAAPSGGTAGFLRGTVEVRLPGSAEWKPLAPGDRLPPGAIVRTLAASSLEIAFENGDTCFLRPETTLGLTETARRGDTWIRRLFLEAGKVIAKVRKATGTQTRFEVKTPSAQCAARGTLFRATADKDDTSRTEVLEGAVDVEAAGSRVGVDAGFGTAVKAGEAPLPPRPLLPPPVPARVESFYRRLPVHVEFVQVPKAAAYFVELTRDAAGRDVVAGAVLAPGRPFEAGTLGDGDYYLHARAVDELGLEGLPSAPVEIRVRTEPRPPRLQGLVDGARLRCGSPSLRWTAVPGAASYEIQMSGNGGFAPLVDRAVVGSPSWTAAGLAVGSYHLRVRSVAADGFEGDWTETTTFSVLPPLPAPVLEKPSRERDRIRLRWNDLGSGIVYRLHIARDPNFAAIVLDEIAPGTETLIVPPAGSGLYYARIKALDGNGCESAYSAARKFRVGGFWATICTPCLLAPLAVLIWLLAR
jgi:hypothetical protein